LVYDIKRGRETDGALEQSADENIWTEEGSDKRLEKSA
jgi:hypothetical protein